jgi:hypothetical protein
MTPENQPYGGENRTSYGYDSELHATIIPTGKSAESGGGSLAFDAQRPSIKQNIVVCEDGEMKTIAVVDPKALRERVDKVAPSAEEVEQTYLTAVNKVPPKETKEMGKSAAPLNVDIPTRRVDEETHEIPPATLDSGMDRVDAPGPAKTAVPVTIRGSFGKVRQLYSSVFRDGNQLVLMSRNKELGSRYELPEIEGEALQLEVQVNKKLLSCVHAGISFTLPDNSVTFTVLLIAEEHESGEGQ